MAESRSRPLRPAAALGKAAWWAGSEPGGGGQNSRNPTEWWFPSLVLQSEWIIDLLKDLTASPQWNMSIKINQ